MLLLLSFFCHFQHTFVCEDPPPRSDTIARPTYQYLLSYVMDGMSVCHVTGWPSGQMLDIALQTIRGHCFVLLLWYCILFIAGCVLASHNFQTAMFLTFNLQFNFWNGYECDYCTIYKYRSLDVWCLVTQQTVPNILKYLWSFIVRDTHFKVMSHVGQIVCI
jgi:hypothetical protein